MELIEIKGINYPLSIGLKTLRDFAVETNRKFGELGDLSTEDFVRIIRIGINNAIIIQKSSIDKISDDFLWYAIEESPAIIEQITDKIQKTFTDKSK